MSAQGHSAQVLVASASRFRQGVYQAAIEGLGHQAVLVDRGIDCVACLKRRRPELLVLESFLPWGGCDGVLEIAQTELGVSCPVIVVAVGGRQADWLQLSRFRVDDFLPRFPGLVALQQLFLQTLGVHDPTDPGAAAGAPAETPFVPAARAVPAPHAMTFGIPTEKRHHPEGSALTSAGPHEGGSAPHLLAARGAVPVDPSAVSDPPAID